MTHRTTTTTSSAAAPQPIDAPRRITSLDAIRGVAVLGILTMNAVSYGLGVGPYFNISASAPQSAFDWVLGAAGEVLFDQKFMGLFSMLFGAGIVLFADRAAAKARHPGLLSLWRNSLLLVIGLAHAALWDGDVLVIYALCSPLLILSRSRSNRLLVTSGIATLMLSPVTAWIVQRLVPADGTGLADYWGLAGPMSDPVALWLLIDFFARSAGMMLIGVAAYRSGFLTGRLDPALYRRIAGWGIATGWGLALLGFAWVAAHDFSPGVALIGSIPNTIGTLPAVAGYASAIILWHRRWKGTRADRRIRSVGRMALSNYLSQTVIGLVVLGGLFGSADLTRTWIAVFIGGVWVLQLAWSDAWLARHRYGPMEWMWRRATYWRRGS